MPNDFDSLLAAASGNEAQPKEEKTTASATAKAEPKQPPAKAKTTKAKTKNKAKPKPEPEARTSDELNTAERFVEQLSEGILGPKVKRGTEKSIGKSKDPDYSKLTVYVREKLHQKLRVHSMARRAEISELVEQALRLYFKENPLKFDDE